MPAGQPRWTAPAWSAGTSLTEHLNAHLFWVGGLGAFSRPYCRKALWGFSGSCNPAFLGLGSLSSRSTGGSSVLSITLSLGPRLSKLSSWECEHRSLSCGIARNCRGVKSGVTRERSQRTQLTRTQQHSSIAFSSLHRCASVHRPRCPVLSSAGRYLSNSFCGPQTRPPVGLCVLGFDSWTKGVGTDFVFVLCFVFCFSTFST